MVWRDTLETVSKISRLVTPAVALEKVQRENCTLGAVNAMLDTQSARVDTRVRILEVAEAAVLAKGFAATSIEEIIAEVGITKSGFFYHFRDKSALAKGLLLRYLENDKQTLDEGLGIDGWSGALVRALAHRFRDLEQQVRESGLRRT